MIRSSKVSLKFCNAQKRKAVTEFIDEYSKVVREFVDLLWDREKIDSLLGSDITDKVQTWLSARAVQAAGKQASSIVRGTRQKQKQRLFQVEKFKKLGQFKKARKLQAICDKKRSSKPFIDRVQPVLDARFINIDLDNKTSFDGWITLGSIGKKTKIVLPFKRTEHFNKLYEKGQLRPGLRLSVNKAEFAFEISQPEREKGKTIGIDIGQKTAITCSDGQSVSADCHQHTYQSICDKLARKQKASKGFKRAQEHRSNFIGWALNRINFKDISRVNRENIKHLRRGKRSSRSLTRWNYSELNRRLEMKLEDLGVQVVLVSPTYTSQRCSECGWVRKSNRSGKLFRCGHCGFECDADLNGARNIALDLPPIGKAERLKHQNRKGFFWSVSCQEPIVPDTQKPNP